MDKAKRQKAIKELEGVRDSRVVTYLTGDRGLASTQITDDVLRIAYDHVRAIGHVPKLDLVLYSRGGDAMLPWPLVTTLRRFCDRLSVLVPFRAHSAATLIALGADEIVMTPIAQLTPIEPTVKMQFSPSDPANPGQKLGINVEDVAAYFSFVRKRAEITGEEGRAKAMHALTEQVSPIALGNLHRSHQLARMQAEQLLALHMDLRTKEAEIKDIVENLVARLWAHEYKIGRDEARGLGLKVPKADEDAEEKLWALFQGYEAAMELRKPITAANAFPSGQGTVSLNDVKLAYVESTEATDAFVADIQMTRPQVPGQPGQPPQFGPQVQIAITRQEWAKE